MAQVSVAVPPRPILLNDLSNPDASDDQKADFVAYLGLPTPGSTALVDLSNVAATPASAKAARNTLLIPRDLYDSVADKLFVPGDMTALLTGKARGAVKIAYVGTSIDEGLSNINPEESYVRLIRLKWQAALGTGAAVTIGNFSLSGRDVGEFNSDTFVGASVENPGVTYFRAAGGALIPYPVEDLWPSGSTINQTWHAAVEAFAPDVLILSFGPNSTSGDANAFNATLFNVIANRAKMWTKAPTVIVETPIMPNQVGSPPAGPTTNTYMEGNAVAARACAALTNSAIIDQTLLWRALREGVDTTNPQFTAIDGAADFASWATSSGTRPSESAGTITFGTDGSVLRPGAADSIDVIGTATMSGNVIAQLFFRTDYRIDIQNHVPQALVYHVPTGSLLGTLALSGSGDAARTTRVKASARGGNLEIYIDGVLFNGAPIIDTRQVYAGQAGFGFVGAGSWSGIAMRYGVPATLDYDTLTDADLVGATSTPYDGDGVHHPSRLGHRVMARCWKPFFAWLKAAKANPANRVWGQTANTVATLAPMDFVGLTVASSAAGGTSMVAWAPDDGSTSGTGGYAAVSGKKLVTVTAGQVVAVVLVKDNAVTPAPSNLMTVSLTLPYPGNWLVSASGWVSKGSTHGAGSVLYRHGLEASAEFQSA